MIEKIKRLEEYLHKNDCTCTSEAENCLYCQIAETLNSAAESIGELIYELKMKGIEI